MREVVRSMQKQADPSTLSLVELSRQLQSGRLSSRAVTQTYLERIAQYDAALGAVVTVDPKAALRQAEEADRLRASGAPVGALHGVPMLIKDFIRVAGIRSTFGMPQYHWHRPRSNARLVQTLRDAGVVVMGRTNVPLSSFDWQCKNPMFGETRNPWDLARTCGGSSGGAAAAVAARFTPFELGSDIAGSIRYPAHCCGVIGMRPADTLLSQDDLLHRSMPAFHHNVLTCGPLTRTVADARLVMQVLTQTDRPARARPLSDLEIAWTAELGSWTPSSSTAELIAGVAAALAQRGAKVTHDSPGHIDERDAYRLWGEIVGYEFAQSFPWFLRLRWVRALLGRVMWRRVYGEGELSEGLTRGFGLRRVQHQANLERRGQLQDEFDAFMSPYDVWLTPVAMTAAIKRQKVGAPIPVDDREVSYSELGVYLCPSALMGHPIVVMPMGQTAGGLPVGIQIHGRRGMDFELLDVAEALSAVLGRLEPARPPDF